MDIKEIIGKTFQSVNVNNDRDEIIFTELVDGTVVDYKMYHSQDCCESVGIEDINGDLQDLVGTPILAASEDTNIDSPKKETYGEGDDAWESVDESSTWTYYNISTIKGSVNIRWYGSSNGYYSESVDFVKVGSEYDY